MMTSNKKSTILNKINLFAILFITSLCSCYTDSGLYESDESHTDTECDYETESSEDTETSDVNNIEFRAVHTWAYDKDRKLIGYVVSKESSVVGDPFGLADLIWSYKLNAYTAIQYVSNRSDHWLHGLPVYESAQDTALYLDPNCGGEKYYHSATWYQAEDSGVSFCTRAQWTQTRYIEEYNNSMTLIAVERNPVPQQYNRTYSRTGLWGACVRHSNYNWNRLCLVEYDIYRVPSHYPEMYYRSTGYAD